MYTLISKRIMWFAAASSICFIATNTVLASDNHGNLGDGPRSKTVNCNIHNASVQRAIDNVKAGRDTIIFIKGFCDESVSIVKDGITLSGNKHGLDTIGGGLSEVKVSGAQRVQIEYLELTGPGYGVLVEEGASVTIRHNNIHNNMADGVGAFNHVFVRVEFNDITGNGRVEKYESGIDGSGGATIRSKGNNIAGNAYAAIVIGNMSFFRSGVSGGIPDDRDTFLQKGCSGGELAGTCGNPESLAVDCFKNGLCDFRNTDVTGRIEISGMSNFDVRPSTIINGNIDGYGGSRLALRNTVNSGLVTCGDATIALYGNPCGDEFFP